MEPNSELTAQVNWDRYRELVAKGDDPKPGDREAEYLREATVRAYIYLCKRVVAKMKKSMPAHVEREDLESLANIGLLQAVTRFDHTLSVPFEAFATQRMRSVIMDGIRDADWAPRSLRKKQRDIAKLEEVYRQKFAQEPTVEDLSIWLVQGEYDEDPHEWYDGEFEEKVQSFIAEISQTKYESDIAAHTYIEGSVEAQNKPASLNEEDDHLVYALKVNAASALRDMEVRKAAIIALHYYDEKKLSVVAKELGMSEVKVGALHQEAVLEIWESLANALSEK